MFGEPAAVFALLTQPIVAEGLGRVLESCTDLRFAGSSTDPASAMRELDRLRPQVLLLDQAFGLRATFELLGTVKRLGLPVRPVLWTKEISRADRRLAVEAGASGILDRTRPVEDLLACLRAVAGGHLWMCDADTVGLLKPRGAHRLTQREREVVALVRGGLKNREIAASLAITPGTVKVHLMHIFEKTGARDRFELRIQAASLLASQDTSAEAGEAADAARGASG